jgi:hypothetical protein
MRFASRQRPWLEGAVILGAVCTVIACGSEPRPVSWEPIDYEAVSNGLSEPTGSLEEIDDAFLADVERRIPYLMDVAAELAHLVATIDNLETNPRTNAGTGDGAGQKSGGATGETSGSVSGTTIFLAIACPGVEQQPARDFTHGQFRVESPAFQSESEFVGVLAEGDLLLMFENCDLPAVRINGSVPVLFRTDESAMVIDLRRISLALYGDALDVPGEPEFLDDEGNARDDLGLPVLGVVVTLDESWSYAVGVDSIIGGESRHFSVNLSLEGSEATVSIRARDGVITCVYDRDGDPRLTCDAS